MEKHTQNQYRTTGQQRQNTHKQEFESVLTMASAAQVARYTFAEFSSYIK